MEICPSTGQMKVDRIGDKISILCPTQSDSCTNSRTKRTAINGIDRATDRSIKFPRDLQKQEENSQQEPHKNGEILNRQTMTFLKEKGKITEDLEIISNIHQIDIPRQVTVPIFPFHHADIRSCTSQEYSSLSESDIYSRDRIKKDKKYGRRRNSIALNKLIIEVEQILAESDDLSIPPLPITILERENTQKTSNVSKHPSAEYEVASEQKKDKKRERKKEKRTTKKEDKKKRSSHHKKVDKEMTSKSSVALTDIKYNCLIEGENSLPLDFSMRE